jgi:hypothetical protein
LHLPEMWTSGSAHCRPAMQPKGLPEMRNANVETVNNNFL